MAHLASDSNAVPTQQEPNEEVANATDSNEINVEVGDAPAKPVETTENAASTENTESSETKSESKSNITVDVSIKYEKIGLGLVIGLSKANPMFPDRPQIVFIREI